MENLDVQFSSFSPSMSFVAQTSFDQLLLAIDMDTWALAEQRTAEILGIFQPTLVSQRKRKEVVDFLAQLIHGYFRLEVFAFGSVPLRTYLPDGDIDVSLLCHQRSVEDLIRGLCNMVEEREDNSDEFKMKDVQVIRAQVKVVKLNVKNIAVDISFNQTAGLGALCFLEEVDRFIGREHLFKRSILLVKAWCFYEGRVLGSHNGLISTYALEIMVLYIINLFHASITGPLGVLYKFLDYFSNFNWQTHCISIEGPIRKSSLPGLVVDPTDIDVDQLLLPKEFLERCKEMFSVPEPDVRTKRFQIKNLNIVDPLKENNNLGRSVSKANAMRIRLAFSFGAKMLSKILMLPMEKMVQELEIFFLNTIDRNGRGLRMDVNVPVPPFGTGRFDRFSLVGEFECYSNDFVYGLWHREHALASDQPPSLPPLPPPLPALSPMNSSDGRWTPAWRFQFHNRATSSSWRGADAFVPKAFLEHSQSLRPRGTGTYIPNMHRHPPRSAQSWSKAKSSGSTSWNPSREEAEAIKIQKKEEEGEGSGNVTLSLEDFPLLLGPSLSDTQSNQSEVISPQVPNPGICFGNFKPPVGPSSSVTTTTKGETSRSGSSSGKGKIPEPLESTGESSTAKSFQLGDEEEFPPLPQ